MPICIANNLPAKKLLEEEGINIIEEGRAKNQDIRPLSILIVNLMPKKEETETQLLRLLGNSPLQIVVDFLHTSSHISKNTSSVHLNKFYISLEDVKNKFYDAMIVTGAPVEHLEFSDVDYWQELKNIFKWSENHVYSSLHICWAAQARLYSDYGINKKKLENKIFGVFKHDVKNFSNPLVRGFTDEFLAPHSRHTEIDEAALSNCKDMEIFASSSEVGTLFASSEDLRKIFITGHIEYDFDTLNNEYIRDKSKGLDIKIPKNYYPTDDENKIPKNTWKTIAYLFYNNWLNEVYQRTPYNLTELLNK